MVKWYNINIPVSRILYIFLVLVAFSIAGVSQANMAHFENSSYLNVVEGMPFEDVL